MVFKQDLTPPTVRGKKGNVVKHTGKGAVEQTLPGRNALNTLTQGSPAQRSMSNYSKVDPLNSPAVSGFGQGSFPGVSG
jgi:hypothetical protein